MSARHSEREERQSNTPLSMNINIIIGRGRDNGVDVPLDHDTISRRHLQLSSTNEPTEYRIEDQNSSNGTFIFHNNRWIQISRMIVYAHTRIRLGTFETTPADIVQAWQQQQEQRQEEGDYTYVRDAETGEIKRIRKN